MSQDVGDWISPTLTVDPHDGTTDTTLTIVAPDGTETTPATSSSDSGATWTAAAYEVDQPGEWLERWTVTGVGASVERRTVLVAPDPTTIRSGQRIYATTADYATWLGTAPPARSRTALAAASRDVDELLLTAVYKVDDDGMPTDPDHVAALRDATCAQAQYARALGDADGVGGTQYAEVQLGSARLVRTNQPPENIPGRHSPQARQILQQAGLTGHEPWTW